MVRAAHSATPHPRPSHHVRRAFGDADIYRLETFDFGRRMAVEREYRAAGSAAPPSNALFDASGEYLLYPSPLGIKVISVATSKLARLLGKVENTERFAGLALFRTFPRRVGSAPRCLTLPTPLHMICRSGTVASPRMLSPSPRLVWPRPRFPPPPPPPLLSLWFAEGQARLSANMIGSGLKITEEEVPSARHPTPTHREGEGASWRRERA